MKEKRKKKWIGSIILLAGIVVMLSSTEEVQAASKKPELLKKTLNLVVGKQKKLSVKKQKGYTVSWKSSKKAVATVSKTGKVKAKKKGNTKITAMMQSAKGDSSYRLICKVTVKQVKKQESSTAKSTDREKNTERNSSDRTSGTPMPAEQRQSGQPESNQGAAGQPGSAGETSERPGVLGQPESNQGAAGQPGSAGQMPDQPFLDEPAASTTGSAITDGKAKLLFGNYDDALWNGDFFGNRMIASYDQLQDLAQGCESIICSLVSDEGVIPPDDFDDPYFIQDIL